MSIPDWPTAATREQYLREGGGFVGATGVATRLPRPDECVLCAGVPAVSVRLRSQLGLVLFMRFKDHSAPYCRDCGIETFRRVQNATIVGGWWGFLAFFVTLSTLAQNAYAYRKLRALPPASGRDDGVAVPNASPLVPGPPLLARWGLKALVAVLCAWTVLAIVVN